MDLLCRWLWSYSLFTSFWQKNQLQWNYFVCASCYLQGVFSVNIILYPNLVEYQKQTRIFLNRMNEPCRSTKLTLHSCLYPANSLHHTIYLWMCDEIFEDIHRSNSVGNVHEFSAESGCLPYIKTFGNCVWYSEQKVKEGVFTFD